MLLEILRLALHPPLTCSIFRPTTTISCPKRGRGPPVDIAPEVDFDSITALEFLSALTFEPSVTSTHTTSS